MIYYKEDKFKKCGRRQLLIKDKLFTFISGLHIVYRLYCSIKEDGWHKMNLINLITSSQTSDSLPANHYKLNINFVWFVVLFNWSLIKQLVRPLAFGFDLSY